jgi:hypothetical protein
MKRPTFHITTSDGSTVFPDVEIVERCRTDVGGIIPNDVRINGVSMHVPIDAPITVDTHPEELTTVTVTLVVNSVSIKREAA